MSTKAGRPILEAYINEPGYNSYFLLQLFKTSKDLEVAAKKLNISTATREDGTWSGFVIQTPGLTEEFDEHGLVRVCFAYCFLTLDDLTHSNIAHEMLHCALLNERLLKRYVGGYPDQDIASGYSHEERLAYCLGSYVGQVVKILTDKGYKIKLV